MDAAPTFPTTCTDSADVTVVPMEIPTLKDTCLASIRKNARKLDYMINQFFNGESTLLLDTKLLAQVLLMSSNYITVDSVRYLEVQLPALTMETECDEVWQKFVKKRYAVREISSPFPIVVAEVSSHVETLRSPSSSVSEKQDALDELYRVPFSDELAKQTSVALTVNTIRKDSSFPASLASSAGQLTTKWKQVYKAQQSLASRSGSVDGGGAAATTAGPVSTGNTGIDSVNILTWRQLFDYYECKEQSMIEKGTKRFSAIASSERDKHKIAVSASSNDMSKYKQDKLQRIISSTGHSRSSSSSSSVFRASGGGGSGKGSIRSAVVHSVASTRGHSALDLLRAGNLQSTKHTKVVTTSSGSVMMIPRGMLDRNRR